MDDYFEIREIHPWLYSIKDRMQVFCYLLTGDREALLLDTAYGFGDLPGAVKAVTGKPLTVVNSHGHVDHASGNPQFAAVFLHPADFEVCRLYTGPKWRGESLKAAWNAGVDLGGLDEEAYLAGGTGRILPLEKEAVFDLGGLSARIVEMPGHTPGSVGIFIPEHKTLLASDAACKATYMFLPESTSLGIYRDMLKRVRRLPFEEHYVGHAAQAFDNAQFDLYIKAAEDARLDNSVRVPLPGFEDREIWLHTSEGALGSSDFTGVGFSPDKL